MKFQILLLTLVCLFSSQLCISAHSLPEGRKVGNIDDEENDSASHPAGHKLQGRNFLAVEDIDFWAKDAQFRLQAKVDESRHRIEREAKNTVMFLGDGMGLATITAARIYKGQKEGAKFGGEEMELYFEKFPYTALSKTYCTDSQVADSACSATAYLCGVKANLATAGVTSDVPYGQCVPQMNKTNHVSSLLAWAQAAGKSTGVVTTTRITHASPSGAYAHIADRDWEYDVEVKKSGFDPATCDDIATQLILQEPGKNINVILGGGRHFFYNATVPDIETGLPGLRQDGKNLVDNWITNNKDRNGKYVYNVTELLAVDPTKVDYLLGLFAPSHISYQSDPLPRDNDPSLSEMTKVAINILSRNPNGFFLFVEGGRIDHAHHANQAQKALAETLEFDKTIQLVDRMTKDEDTLLVVTADHSHVMTINGYPRRGNPLLEIGGEDDYKDNRQHYATLSYANGPGQTPFDCNSTTKICVVRNITEDKFDELGYRQLGMIKLDSETHGGEDVIIFAKGPFSYLFSGVQQQSFIPHVMAYASCTGSGLTFCGPTVKGTSTATFINTNILYSCFSFLLMITYNNL